MSSLFHFPVRSLAPRSIPSLMCAQCRRSFASSPALYSGHNRWSKIKHEKGAADAKKVVQRSIFAHKLALFSKLFGPDPSLNSQLAMVIAAAKKAGMPKANIEVAIARGQGKSTSGVGLENVTYEVMMPPNVALIINVETENKQRALQELRIILKKYKGTATPTSFLFTKKGRTTLSLKSGTEFDEVMMQALDAGAEDVEQDEDDNLVIWTQPNTTHQTAQNLSKVLSADIMNSELLWTPTGEKVRLDSPEETTTLGKFMAALQDHPDVEGVYANVERGDVTEEVWSLVEENLDT